MNTTLHNTLRPAFGPLLTHSMGHAMDDEIIPVHSMDDEIIPVH